ncbi:MAG: glycoside hydrolase TIM-barrel-like domain-containing protein [Pseudomonadota bacterium]
MATLVLAAAGSTIGGMIGGTVLGVSSAIIGQAIGATIGSAIDQTWMAPSQNYETGRVENYRLHTASEGAPIPRVYGRFRVAGQLIWRDTYTEHKSTTSQGGGKGGGPKVSTTEYSYSVNLAIALGEGVMSRVGRVWADGQELPRDELDFVFYAGTDDQPADDTIAAVEGLENTPAFRGTAYVVFRDLDVTQFGNRIPQFNFEVFRQPDPVHKTPTAARSLRSVCLIPGSGEFVYGTTPITHEKGDGAEETANAHARYIGPDIELALDQLQTEMPNVDHVSLVVTWFGDNLNCGSCRVGPRVETSSAQTRPVNWSVAGLSRGQADLVSQIDDRPAFGGTPSDASVLEVIAALKSRGMRVTLYPFVMMDIPTGTVGNDPYGAEFQAAYPWRGLITSDADGTATVANDVSGFFGNSTSSDFNLGGNGPRFTGSDFDYRALVFHYAHLAAQAGGVDGFLIGSELRGITRLRDDQNGFPGVDALVALLEETRLILGASTQLGYAADWSEYFGYQPGDGSSDVFYNLDPLWAHDDLDFIGIDAYFPLSDWRDEADHLDAAYRYPRNAEYLAANIQGGEGYDWYYASDTDRELQTRSSITDGAYGQDWVFRYKDVLNWWSNPHVERPGGAWGNQTAWEPRSKPIVFTEIGCPAVRFAANQPNVFTDPKSEQPQLPYFSDGAFDPVMQEAYLTAWMEYWIQPDHNPKSEVYDGHMIDLSMTSAWCWDARPYPYFPALEHVWADGPQYATGHWLTGRFQGALISEVIAELCEAAGVTRFDVSALYGRVDGAMHDGATQPRIVIQALMMRFDILAADKEGVLTFFPAEDAPISAVDLDRIVAPQDGARLERLIAPELEQPDAIAVRFYDGADAYEPSLRGSGVPGAHLPEVSVVQDLPVVAQPEDIVPVSERLLSESGAAGQSLIFATPPSRRDLKAGDQYFDRFGQRFRVVSISEAEGRRLELQGLPDTGYVPAPARPTPTPPPVDLLPAKPEVLVLDLPQLSADQSENVVYLATQADPWQGGVAVYRGSNAEGYSLLGTQDRPSMVGILTSDLVAGHPDIWSGQSFTATFSQVGLSSLTDLAVLNGGNAFAIGTNGGTWEIVQIRDITLQPDGSVICRNLLRGQLGSEAVMPAVWPAGTRIVALNSSLISITPIGDDWDQASALRIGPINQPVSHPSFRDATVDPQGIGLHAYAPAHVRYRDGGSGDLVISFVPRVANEGQSWSGEVAIRYTSYRIRVLRGEVELRSAEVGWPEWTYSAGAQAQDGFAAGDVFAVSALTPEFGYGFEARREFNG